MKSLGSIRRSFTPWNDPVAKPYIAFQNVTKKFGDFTAVDGLTLHVYEKEFFSLLGASGCGKTTLLRMLAGFEDPTSGDILLEGRSLKGVPPHRRPVNMMFQSYALFPHMTVEQNIAFGLHQERMEKSAVAQRVSEMLKLVKMEQFTRRKPHQLSGGQRQRVALARALAKRPKLLLLDEPLGALDKKLREETQFELMDLQHQLGLTFMIVTHDQEEAMTMSDRIAVMDRGRILQIGTPAEIYEAPNSRFVADFIGNVNMIEGIVESTRDGIAEITAKDGFAMHVASPDGLEKGSAVWLAIRPEKLRVARSKPQAAANAVEGEIWDVGYLGDMTVFNIRLGSGTIMKASVMNAQRIVEDPVGYDDRIWVSFEPDSGILLTR